MKFAVVLLLAVALLAGCGQERERFTDTLPSGRVVECIGVDDGYGYGLHCFDIHDNEGEPLNGP